MKNEKEIAEIWKVLRPLLKKFNMTNWDVKVAYSPVAKPENFAEVETVYQTRSVKIVVYCLKDLKDTLTHELVHSQIGLIGDYYEEVLDGMIEIIKAQGSKMEEFAVDNMNKVMSNE